MNILKRGIGKNKRKAYLTLNIQNWLLPFSVGKALVGIALFGAARAIVGLKGKKKKLKKLFIPYKEDENTEAKDMVFLQKIKNLGVKAVILKVFKNDFSAAISGKYIVKRT